MGHLLGYARVSTVDQHPQLQVDALQRAGCYRVFTETASGARTDRPILAQVLDQLRPGDPWSSGNSTASAAPCVIWSTSSPAWLSAASGSGRSTMTIGRVWRRARQAAFTAEVAASPLARTPYDLRHAAVSTWLNGGVPPTTVAEWAGHSVEVLLRIYAKCLNGGDALVHRRVQAALGYEDTATDVSLSHVRP